MKSMRKIICTFLLIAVLSSMTICGHASGLQVCLNGSSFEVGDTASVDEIRTLESIYNNGISDEYNAYLEKNVQYEWFRDGISYVVGKSLALIDSDADCTFFCRAYLYSDSECTQFVSYIDSPSFYVSEAEKPDIDLRITTSALPNAQAGEYYKKQIDCTVPGASFSTFRSSLPPGLYISESGLIYGTPEQAGFWYVVIMAEADGVQATEEYEFYVDEAAEDYGDPPEITTKSLPAATAGKSYYAKLECTDPDSVFQIYYNPGKANDFNKTGLYITQHGEIEGTPSKAGSYTFTVSAAGEFGEGYRTYTLTIKDAPAPKEPEQKELEKADTKPAEDPDKKTDDPEEVTDGSDSDKNAEQDNNSSSNTDNAGQNDNSSDKNNNNTDQKDKADNTDSSGSNRNVGVYIGTALAAFAAAIIVTVIYLKFKKKH